jgi:excisionase family DNA binding protein
MNCTKHSPSRLVDVTDQTGVTSSQAAASAARPNARPERLVTLATTGANKDRRRAMAERLLTVQEAGEMLNTGERFPRRLIAERRIRFVRVGRHVRIPEGAIAEYVAAQTVEAVRLPGVR